MKRIPIALILASGTGLSLSAQQRAFSVTVATAPGYASLEEVVRARGNKGAVVLVLGDPKGVADLDARLHAMISADEALSAFGLDFEHQVSDSDGWALELQKREGWDTRTRWALVMADRSLVASGTDVPTPSALLQNYQDAGLKSRPDMVADFLREHPEHTEANAALLWFRAMSAERQMKRLHVETPPPTAQDKEPKPRLKAPLATEEDARIWGETARLWEHFIHSGSWLGEDARRAQLEPETARFSPLMQDTARRLLPDVEEAIEAYPCHERIWNTWWILASLAGELKPQELIGRLSPLPDTGDFPPGDVVTRLTEAMRAKEDWAGILGLQTPKWDQWKATIFYANGTPETQAQILEMPWQMTLAPMVEAALKSDRGDLADKWVKEGVAWARSKRYAELAAQMAKACGREDLGERWKQLNPGAAAPEARKAAPDAKAPSLESMAANYGETFWLLVDDARGEGGKAFQKAVKSDVLVEFADLPSRTVTQTGEPKLVQELAARFGWKTGKGLLLVDPKGRVLGDTSEPIEAVRMLGMLALAGVEPQILKLEKHLLAHPSQDSALQALLAARLRMASSRMQAYLPPLEEKALADPHAVDARELLRPLSPEEDGRIWGASARLLEQGFREDAFRLDDGMVASALSPTARHSPLMRAAAAKAILRQEDRMANLGGHAFTDWMMWSALNACLSPKRSALALWQRIPILPGNQHYIPSDAIVPCAREARERKDWAGLRAFLEPWRPQILEMLRILSGGANDYRVKDAWEQLGPLVEAYLRLNDAVAAETLVQDLVSSTASTLPARKASVIAQACGRPDLARRWAAMNVPKPDTSQAPLKVGAH